MKKNLLQKLVGMSVTSAKAIVTAVGHKVHLVPENCTAITLQARPNTVILWQKDGKITAAQAGDPVELE